MPRIRYFILPLFFLAQILPARFSFAYSTDELIGKAVNATTSLAKGNVSGAAEQAIGGYHIPIAPQTNMHANLGGVSLQQGIKPLSMSNPYLNLGSSYNANANLSPNRYPNLSQNFQVNSNTPYFSNTTSIPASFKKR